MFKKIVTVLIMVASLPLGLQKNSNTGLTQPSKNAVVEERTSQETLVLIKQCLQTIFFYDTGAVEKLLSQKN